MRLQVHTFYSFIRLSQSASRRNTVSAVCSHQNSGPINCNSDRTQAP